MTTTNGWLDPAPGIPVRKVDLSGSRGNGPFDPSRGRDCKGWILHVNVGNTPVDLFTAGTDKNPYSVTPTIQVYKSATEGGVVQFLPLDCQPWCQIDGNFNYGAAETAGFPNEAMTDFQLDALAYYQAELVKTGLGFNSIADSPGQKGIGTHVMGGAAWGGHTCPGPGPRAGQRTEILRRAQLLLNPPEVQDVTPEEARQIAQEAVANGLAALRSGENYGHFVGDGKDAGYNDRLTRLEERDGIDKHGKPVSKK